MLIDVFLKQYSFSERHSIPVKASPDELYPIVLNADLGTSRLIKLLFRLRGMPSHRISVNRMEELGFIRLAENPAEEIVFGIVTQSWMFNGCTVPLSSNEFLHLNEKGHIKAVINFHLKKADDVFTLLSTETRVFCTDEQL